MAAETVEEACECLANGTTLDERTMWDIALQLLCQINTNTAASGGSVTPIAALLTQSTVTAGVASSAAVAAQAARRGGQLRNLSLTDSFNVNLGGAAVAAAPGLGYVPPGGIYTLPAYYTGAVNVIRSGAVDVTVEVLTW